MSHDIETTLNSLDGPRERLQSAAQTFLAYWIDHPDHFRLVFMSSEVTRADVAKFVTDEDALVHFRMFSGLIKEVHPEGHDVKVRFDTLISGLIGIALCMNTVADYPWSNATSMTNQLLSSIIA
jgi:hypothetical protein